MSSEASLRELICTLAKSMFYRGLTGGSTGNISARTDDGGLLISPTGTSFGRLDPARLSRFDATGRQVTASDPIPTDLLISSFTEDASGELYLLDLNWSLYQIVAV